MNTESSQQLPNLLALQWLHTAQQRGVDYIYILVQRRQSFCEKKMNDRKTGLTTPQIFSWKQIDASLHSDNTHNLIELSEGHICSSAVTLLDYW